MAPLLYLDTARLGQMKPAAKDAQLDFVRLSAEEPSSLYFEQFLRDGFTTWPSYYRERFPGLRTWPGVAGLKHSLRRLVNAPDDWRVCLANRSLSLVNVAASCMFRLCRNLLATDLSWPTYQQAIEAKARRTGNRITTVPLLGAVLNHHWTANDVIDYLADAFRDNNCDGLFLPAVDHLGIRLPIRRIVEAIRRKSELRFCLIDAAQALCHVPLADTLSVADFVVAGSHKWMGAYLPTGIGYFGQRHSSRMIERRLRLARQSGNASDPLLHFVEQIDTGKLDGHSETANLTSLFACAGAVSEQLALPSNVEATSVANRLATIPRPSERWSPRLPDEGLRSRIVLFESSRVGGTEDSADAIRQSWLDAGCVVTAYAGGRARVSLPL